MSAYTTEGGRTATYPSNGYPSANFAGAGMPGRAGTPPRPGGGRSAVSSALPAVARNHVLIAVLVVVGGGYALWHFTATLK